MCSYSAVFLLPFCDFFTTVQMGLAITKLEFDFMLSSYLRLIDHPVSVMSSVFTCESPVLMNLADVSQIVVLARSKLPSSDLPCPL